METVLTLCRFNLFRLGHVQTDVQVFELFWRCLARGVHHGVFVLAVHDEGVDFAQVRLVRQNHYEAVDAEGAAAVRGGAEAEGVQHSGEFMLQNFLRIARNSEGFFHDVGAVVPDRAGGNFEPVADAVVLVREDVCGVGFFQRFQPALRH